jgi:hypothetical protein
VRNKTLNLKRPNGKTFGLTVIFLLLFIGTAEISLRFGFLQPQISRLVPSLGSRHQQMELQLARLESKENKEDKVDCIILGSSLVWLGVDPDIFEIAYKHETGQDINCFNLGIETMSASAAGVIANFVVDRYQPHLLIYGTSARDYAVGAETEETEAIINTPWLQYYLGNHSIRGWLYTHSLTIRYLREMRSLFRLDLDEIETIGSDSRSLNGFLAKTRPAKDIHFQHAADDAAKWLQPYEIQQANLLGLEQVVDLQSDDLQVVVVEMPVSDTYYNFFTNGRQDYDRFIHQIEDLLGAKGSELLRTSTDHPVPNDGWWEYSHMNAIGAKAFSKWLGREVGRKMMIDEL